MHELGYSYLPLIYDFLYIVFFTKSNFKNFVNKCQPTGLFVGLRVRSCCAYPVQVIISCSVVLR